MKSHYYNTIYGPQWLFDGVDDSCVFVVMDLSDGKKTCYDQNSLLFTALDVTKKNTIYASREKIDVEYESYLALKSLNGDVQIIKSGVGLSDKNEFVSLIMDADQLYKTLSFGEKVIYEHALNAAYSFITKEG